MNFMNCINGLINPQNVNNATQWVNSATYQCFINRTVVEFRPFQGWKGEFGFDWMRINDISAYEEIRGDNTYEDSIIASEKSGFKPKIAYEDLKSEYEEFTEYDKFSGFDKYNEYFIPYLNIYSEKASKDIAADFLTKNSKELKYKPPYIADINLISLSAGDRKPTKVELSFPSDYLEISIDGTTYNKTGILDLPINNNFDYGKTEKQLVQLPNHNILKIKCIKDLPQDEYIEIWSEYEFSGIKKRVCSGKLKVCQNDDQVRETIKAVIVEVILSEIDMTITSKNFVDITKEWLSKMKLRASSVTSSPITAGEEQRFYNTFYQALVYPDIEKVESDMSLHSKLQINANLPESYISHDFLVKNNPNMVNLPKYLKDIFLKQGTNANKYNSQDTFFGFFLPTRGEDGNLGITGMENMVFQKYTVMFDTEYNPETLAHEGLHGYGVYHTHNDNYNVTYHPIPKDAKYLFWHTRNDSTKATSNIMNYRNAYACYSTWRWQWKIIRSNI